MALTPTPSELRVTTLSVDSRFADQIYGTTADYMIRLPATMRNVGRVGLTSIEVPQVGYVFSAAATIANTTLAVTDPSGLVVYGTATIGDGNYEGADLATAVSDAMTIGLGLSGSCDYNPISNRFSFLNTGVLPFTLALQSPNAGVAARPRDWGLGFNLGFRSFLVTVPVGAVVAPAPPSLGLPAYLLLQLQCPDMMENTLHRLADGSYVQALAKIVLRPGPVCGAGTCYYQVQYDDARNGLRKENVFVRPTSIAQLRIRLLDAYGAVVEMGDTDWSATFEFTEVVSAGQYAALNRAMPSMPGR